ncbi:PadR family transcriptional regulator [Eubacterium sp. AB3007]|uniref:PadR family transcriptional regulator n=1 Tax=Eubacterium sp. AB3007 TaxID=1392487 RepID=UPI00047F5DED|nr:helix-turn-helix transcriptional regulator [Eubacterium sp. AB3007]MBQ1471763.1 helix-turn-helix transcriptional regulator [Eubacterium sp.]
MGRTANSGALTETVTYILLRLHRPAHGYALMKDIAQMTDGRVKLGAGSLYGALDTLQKKGWIRALDEHPQDRRIEYIITDTGKKFFEKELLRLQELLQNAEKIKEVPYEDDR